MIVDNISDSINSKIISEELSISWRLKKQIGENVMYVASDLKNREWKIKDKYRLISNIATSC
jgi:hypothetical protein